MAGKLFFKNFKKHVDIISNTDIIRVSNKKTTRKEIKKMKKFEVGKSYVHGWAGDSELTTTWEVIARTAQTITIKNGNEIRKRRINKTLTEWNKAETVLPFGDYSMAPILTAE